MIQLSHIDRRQEDLKMYHIPKDKRAEQSAEKLYQGLMKSLKTKELCDVTTAETVRNANVSRATFYRLFDNTADILTWRCETIMQESIIRGVKGGEKSSSDAFVYFASCWLENKELLSSLMKSGRMDILSLVHERHMEEIKTVFLSGVELKSVQEELLPDLLTSMMSAAYKIAVRHPEYTGEDLLLLLQDSLSTLVNLFGTRS